MAKMARMAIIANMGWLNVVTGMVTVGGGTRGLQGFEATASEAASKSNNEVGVASQLACYKATLLQ